MFYFEIEKNEIQIRIIMVPEKTAEGTVNLSVESVAVDTVKTTPFERRFNPYDFNGG